MSSFAASASAFDPEAHRTDATSLTRAVLQGTDAWTVSSGYVNVFASLTSEAGVPGRRHHMFHAPEGTVLFGLPILPPAIIEAVGTGATILTPMTRAAIAQRLQDPETAAATRKQVDWWIHRLCEFMAGGGQPQGCVGYGAGEEMHLPEGGCIRPASGVLAIELLAGSARLFGRATPLAEGDRLALSSRAWLDVGSSSILKVTTLSAWGEHDEAWRALATLHQAILAGLAERLGDIVSHERSRSTTRMASSVAASASALGTIAATFHRTSLERVAPRPRSSAPNDQLNAACALVLDRLGIRFVAPAATTHRTIKEGIENVARASHFRARHVVLTDGWWHEEQGPLVGFLKDGNHAVALLPRGRARYDLVPTDGSPPRRVDATVAATLSASAVTFYRSFGLSPINLLQVMRFSISGCQRDLLMVLLAGGLAGVIGMGVPIATGVLVNSIIPATDRTQLTQWTLMLIVCTFATAMFNIIRSIALVRLEMKLGYVIQAAVWDRLVSLPARFFRDYSAGNLATRAMGIDSVRQTLSGPTIRGVLGGLFSVFNFALMFYYNAVLALAGSAVIGLAVVMLVSIAYMQRIQQRQVVSVQAKTSGVVLQLLTGIRKLRVAAAEMRAFGLWARLFSDQRRAQLKIVALSSFWKMFASGLPLITYGVLFSVIISSSAGGASMRTGDFLAFLAAFSGCINAVLQLATAAIGALSVIPQYEMARPILQALPEISTGQADPGQLTGEIAVDRVVFGYQADAPPVLNDISFRIKPGEFVAFVGPSGSGKSTILRLLLGFEQPQSGAVSYDSRDFKDLDVRAVRRQIGVVLQSGRLMPGDIYTNIIGCSSATMEDAWAASKMAGFDEDLKRMPMGMHTMVTDGGGTLSGGQRQRLMIARAIVSNPKMLFFDEATSALDNQTQAIVSESLDRLRATRIVIAHRLSTIINADRIFVIEKGRIVQCGSYTELMAQAGPFKELASRQLA